MTQQELLEYNKRCAEFLEWKYFGRGFDTPFDNASFMNGEPTSICPPEDLKFHSDWNWIMEVVEAIEKKGFDFVLLYKNVYIRREFDYWQVYKQENKKEAVVQAINQFLIWYNKQEKS